MFPNSRHLPVMGTLMEALSRAQDWESSCSSVYKNVCVCTCMYVCMFVYMCIHVGVYFTTVRNASILIFKTRLRCNLHCT